MNCLFTSVNLELDVRVSVALPGLQFLMIRKGAPAGEQQGKPEGQEYGGRRGWLGLNCSEWMGHDGT